MTKLFLFLSSIFILISSMAQPVKAAYNCSQADLYTVCQQVIDSLDANLPSFAAHKAKYDSTFVANARQKLNDARTAPTEQQRAATHQLERQSLYKLNLVLCNQWQTLKTYITETYGDDDVVLQANLNAAGQSYYQLATQQDWDSAKILAQSASDFISQNLSDLTTVGYMPSNFQTDFDNLKDDHAAQHAVFLTARDAAAIGTEEKIMLNNTIYSEVAKICADGKAVFSNSAAKTNLFTISHLLNLTSGTGIAGVRGFVTSDDTGAKIQGVIVKIQETGDQTVTDANGKYNFAGLSAGTYTLVFEEPNYLPRTEIKTLNAGVISGLDVALLAVVTP